MQLPVTQGLNGLTVWPIIDDCVVGNPEDGDYTQDFPVLAADLVISLAGATGDAELLRLIPEGVSKLEYLLSIIPPHIKIELE